MAGTLLIPFIFVLRTYNNGIKETLQQPLGSDHDPTAVGDLVSGRTRICVMYRLTSCLKATPLLLRLTQLSLAMMMELLVPFN